VGHFHPSWKTVGSGSGFQAPAMRLAADAMPFTHFA
jgi:hypothetical protein